MSYPERLRPSNDIDPAGFDRHPSNQSPEIPQPQPAEGVSPPPDNPPKLTLIRDMGESAPDSHPAVMTHEVDLLSEDGGEPERVTLEIAYTPEGLDQDLTKSEELIDSMRVKIERLRVKINLFEDAIKRTQESIVDKTNTIKERLDRGETVSDRDLYEEISSLAGSCNDYDGQKALLELGLTQTESRLRAAESRHVKLRELYDQLS